MLEGFHALKHSKGIIEGRFWRVAGYALLFLIGSEGLTSLGSFAASPAGTIVLGAIGDMLNLFLVCVATVLYLHLDRTRFGFEE